MFPEFLTITNEADEEFLKIAEVLLNHYVIRNHVSEYRITELEIYWTSINKVDKCVYERKHVNPSCGQWFIHFTGVDIALKNKDGYGGVLIRSLYDLGAEEINLKHFKGPLVCAMKIFSGMNAFSANECPSLQKKELKYEKIIRGPRKGLGKNAIESSTDKLDYNFSIKINGK